MRTAQKLACASARAGARVRYGVLMTERREVDRTAWAAYVQRLVDQEARSGEHGAVSRVARRVGVTPKTITRWLNSEVGVSLDSVGAVARATDTSTTQLLRDLGYEGDVADELAGPAAPDPADLEERLWHALAAVGLDEGDRREVIAYLRARRAMRDEAAGPRDTAV